MAMVALAISLSKIIRMVFSALVILFTNEKEMLNEIHENIYRQAC